MTEREIAIQLIALMAHVEGISEENRFVPPIEVTVTDRDSHELEFEYSPEWDELNGMLVPPKLPVTLRLTDAEGSTVETRLTDLTLRADWIKHFLQ
jgi:hypothetical protein